MAVGEVPVEEAGDREEVKEGGPMNDIDVIIIGAGAEVPRS
jgi:hypothetical protein